MIQRMLTQIVRINIDQTSCRGMSPNKIKYRQDQAAKLVEENIGMQTVLFNEQMKFCSYWSFEEHCRVMFLPKNIRYRPYQLTSRIRQNQAGQLQNQVQAFVETEIKKIKRAEEAGENETNKIQKLKQTLPGSCKGCQALCKTKGKSCIMKGLRFLYGRVPFSPNQRGVERGVRDTAYDLPLAAIRN